MPSLKRILRRDVLVTLPIVGGFLTFVSAVLGQSSEKASTTEMPPNVASRDQPVSFKGLLREIEELRSRLEETDSQLSRLSQFDPPVGSVIAFIGRIPLDEEKRYEWELRTGWLVCDGRKLFRKHFKELFECLSGPIEPPEDPKTATFYIPDLRGTFLRGADIQREGQLAGKDREGRRDPGHFQEYATARPRQTEFATSGQNDGAHYHHTDVEGQRYDRVLSQTGRFSAMREFSDNNAPNEEPDLGSSRPMGSGVHGHTIKSGGDDETRPVNHALYWIIKASSRGFTTIASPGPDA